MGVSLAIGQIDPATAGCSFRQSAMKVPLKNSAAPKPPPGLSAAARRWWRRITDEFAVDDAGGELLLLAALQAFDRVNDARAAIRREGVTVTDRWGQVKPNPACA